MDEPNVKGLELLHVALERDHLYQGVVEAQSDHAVLWVDQADDACL